MVGVSQQGPTSGSRGLQREQSPWRPPAGRVSPLPTAAMVLMVPGASQP